MFVPTLVYDDDCGFCTWSAALALRNGPFEAVGFSELTDEQRARLPANYASCAHLLTPDRVYSCGAATERSLELMYPTLVPIFATLRRAPGYPRLREVIYRWISRHRDWWGRVASRDPSSFRRDGRS